MAQALADQGNAAADHDANLRRLEEIKESLRVVQTCNLTYCPTVTFVTIAAASLSARSARSRLLWGGLSEPCGPRAGCPRVTGVLTTTRVFRHAYTPRPTPIGTS